MRSRRGCNGRGNDSMGWGKANGGWRADKQNKVDVTFSLSLGFLDRAKRILSPRPVLRERVRVRGFSTLNLTPSDASNSYNLFSMPAPLLDYSATYSPWHGRHRRKLVVMAV